MDLILAKASTAEAADQGKGSAERATKNTGINW